MSEGTMSPTLQDEPQMLFIPAIPESPVSPETSISPAVTAEPPQKRKGKSRLLNGFQRISSSPSLVRMGLTSNPTYKDKKASVSCISLSPSTSHFGVPFTPTLSAELSSASPETAPSTPGVLIPVFDEKARVRYLEKIESSSTVTIPKTLSHLVCTPVTAATTTSSDYDYFSIPVPKRQPRSDFNVWRDLPSEIRTQVLTYLHPKEIVRCSSVSKQWHRECFDGQLWAELDTADFYQSIPANALISIIVSAGPFLRDLNLRGCVQLKDKWYTRGLSEACHNLEYISLEGCRIDRTSVHCFLLQNPRLRHVNLTGLANVTNAAMKIIAQSCPRLEHLNVSWCHNVDTRGLKKVVEGCHNLTELRAGEIRGWDDLEFAQLLFETNRLETLCLINCDSLSNDALRVLMQGVEAENDLLTGEPIVPDRRLKQLNLQRCRSITDHGVRYLASRLSNLESLQLGKCSTLTDDSIKPLLASMTALTHLDLEDLDQLTNSTLQALAASVCAPILRHLSISYCENLGDVGMLQILKHCQALQSLDLDNTRISDLVLVEAAAMVRARSIRLLTPRTPPTPTLRLMAYDCQNVTWTGIREILSRNAEVITQRRMVPGPLRTFSQQDTTTAPTSPSTVRHQHQRPTSPEQTKSLPVPAAVSTETVQLVRTYPSEIIQLKCFYNYQPTVHEHTKRVLRGDFASANRLERKWAEFMVANEEAGADGAGARRRRRRARLAEMMHADEADSTLDLGAHDGGVGAGGVSVGGNGGGVGGGRRRRARSGGCAVM